MSTAPRTPRIDLEQTRTQAKELVKAVRAGDADALDRVRWNHPRFRRLTDEQILQQHFVLADAQLVIARLHYFDSWPKLLRHVESLTQQDPLVLRFERAADLVISGDIPALRDLLSQHPGLIAERSPRAHHAPLLHYVAANGVEDYRQISPPNAPQVAEVLLDSGAEVDATSDAYGGGSTALMLTATSAHPRLAGVQIPLIDVLLAHGACIEGVPPATGIVRAALANGCPEAAEALVARGARVDDVVVAAGIGRMDLLRQLAAASTQEQLGRALVMAARYGRSEALAYLLEQGADVTASDGTTALHEAAGRADVAMVRLLLDRGAPLEVLNAHGGTVLSGTLWFAFHTSPAEFARRDYSAVIDELIGAGAHTDVYPQMSSHIEEVRRRTTEQRA